MQLAEKHARSVHEKVTPSSVLSDEKESDLFCGMEEGGSSLRHKEIAELLLRGMLLVVRATELHGDVGEVRHRGPRELGAQERLSQLGVRDI